MLDPSHNIISERWRDTVRPSYDLGAARTRKYRDIIDVFYTMCTLTVMYIIPVALASITMYM